MIELVSLITMVDYPCSIYVTPVEATLLLYMSDGGGIHFSAVARVVRGYE